MDFELSEDQQMIRATVAELAGKFDDHYWMTKDQNHEFPTEFYNAFAEGGWLGITTPEEYGGHGFGITEASIILEEVAASGAGMNGASSMHLSIFGMHPVIVHGSEELKSRTLPRIVTGDLHVCFGVTEPGAGLDTTKITTFARREGDRYIVNGRKVWISKALESEKVLLLTRTTKFEDVKRKTDGLTLFLTDLDRSKIEIRPIPKMGRNAVSSNELFIDGLEVPVEDRVGEEGEGFRYLVTNLPQERLSIAATGVAAARAAFDQTLAYVKERQAFGQAVGGFQNTRFRMAEIATEIELGQTFIDRCVLALNARELTAEEAAMAKWWCTELQKRVVDACVQLHGGYGYMLEYPIARAYADARITTIYGGTTEIMKEIIGRGLGV